jgi:hypothetical protein
MCEENCSHSMIDENNTCMLCGECDMGFLHVESVGSFASFSSHHILPRSTVDRRIINFRNIMNKKSGKQPFRLKPKEHKIIQDVIFFLYKNDYNERKIRDVLKKLKLMKYINDSYLIYCIFKNIPCQEFSKYEPYFEYVYVKMFNLYSKTFPYKYFISGSFVLSKLLNEVGIENKYWFKNIETFENQNHIYNLLRKSVPITYEQFSGTIN